MYTVEFFYIVIVILYSDAYSEQMESVLLRARTMKGGGDDQLKIIDI